MASEIILGVGTSLIGTIAYASVGGGYRRWFGRKIEIREPTESGFLAPAEIRRGVEAHPVSGTLSYLPKDHKIWLVVADVTHGKFWPQGFEPVERDDKTGAWTGYVTVFGWHQVTIFAVVAPPTSQDFFRYFQRVGQKTGYDPLLGIPSECRERAIVQAKCP